MERHFYQRYVYLLVLLLGQYPYHKTPSTKLEINDLISTLGLFVTTFLTSTMGASYQLSEREKC